MSTGRHWAVEWANMRALFARHVIERSKASSEQRTSTEGHDRRHVRCGGRPDHHYATRSAYVPGQRGWTQHQAQAREGADGPAEESTARAASDWSRTGRTRGSERDTTRRPESGPGHDKRRRRTYSYLLPCSAQALCWVRFMPISHPSSIADIRGYPASIYRIVLWSEGPRAPWRGSGMDRRSSSSRGALGTISHTGLGPWNAPIRAESAHGRLPL